MKKNNNFGFRSQVGLDINEVINSGFYMWREGLLALKREGITTIDEGIKFLSKKLEQDSK